MRPGNVLRLASLVVLAWVPCHVALAQSGEAAKVAACLNSSALLGMTNADAVVNMDKTSVPTAPEIGGEAYVADMGTVYDIPSGQLRYHAKFADDEPLFVRFGTALGAPGAMYVLVSTELREGSCAFIRLNLRDRWMRTYRDGEVWELIDRASVTYENGVFGYLKMALGSALTPSDPAHVYTLRHEAFRCPGQVGLHRTVHMSGDGRGLRSFRFTGSDGVPSWGEVTQDRLVPMQRFFCGNGADSRIATHFQDASAALAAWRTENQN